MDNLLFDNGAVVDVTYTYWSEHGLNGNSWCLTRVPKAFELGETGLFSETNNSLIVPVFEFDGYDYALFAPANGDDI